MLRHSLKEIMHTLLLLFLSCAVKCAHGALSQKSLNGKSCETAVSNVLAVSNKSLPESPRVKVLHGDLFKMIILPMLTDKPTMLAFLQDINLSFIYLINLPRMLEKFVDGIRFDEALLEELLELFSLRVIMRDRFELVFTRGSLKQPKSRPALEYAVKAAPLASADHAQIRAHFRKLVSWLREQEDFALLDYLIQISPKECNSLNVCSNHLITMRTVRQLAQQDKNMALRFMQAFDNDCCAALVGILLVPLTEHELNVVLDFAMSLSHRMSSISTILNRMITAASNETIHFPQQNTRILEQNMLFFHRIMPQPLEREVCRLFLVPFVRILYSIRFGIVSNEDIVADIDAFEASGASKRLFRGIQNIQLMLFATVHANNLSLFKTLWSKLKRVPSDLQSLILTRPDLQELFSDAESEAILSQMNVVEKARFLKITRRCQADYEWISEIKNGSVLLLVLAELGDLTKFNEVVRSLAKDGRNALYFTMCRIVDEVPNPVPFVEIILSVSTNQNYNACLSKFNFLRALLLDTTNNTSIFALLTPYKIPIEHFVCEALLKDQTLANSIDSEKGRLLRKHLQVSPLVLARIHSGYQLLRLLRILLVPFTVDKHAFTLRCKDVQEFNDTLNNLLARLMLEDLDRLATRPGFLSYLTLAYTDNSDILNMVRFTTQSALSTFNPLSLSKFDLLEMLHEHDNWSFVTYADWQVVVAFYAVVIDDRLRGLACRIRNGYPRRIVSFGRVIKEDFKNETISLKFLSIDGLKRFERDVLPVIEQVCKEVKCTLVLSVIKEATEKRSDTSDS